MSLTSYFYDPFHNSSVFTDYDRLFNAAFDARTSADNSREVSNDTRRTGFLKPRMDLHESKEKNEVTATFELPGMKKEDVHIDVHGQRLVISGQSTQSEEVDKDGYAVRERRYGRFERVIPLPAGIKPEDVKANMEHGLLTVRFPKSTPEQEPKKITIS